MRLEAIAGDSFAPYTADVSANAEGAHVVITIDPIGNVRADAMLTPDQAEALAEALMAEARLARVIPEEGAR